MLPRATSTHFCKLKMWFVSIFISKLWCIERCWGKTEEIWRKHYVTEYWILGQIQDKGIVENHHNSFEDNLHETSWKQKHHYIGRKILTSINREVARIIDFFLNEDPCLSKSRCYITFDLVYFMALSNVHVFRKWFNKNKKLKKYFGRTPIHPL